MPLMKLKYSAYPELIKTMENRHIEYNETLDYIAQQEAAGKLLVLRPGEALPLSRIEKDPEKLKVAYNIGRTITAARIDEIKSYLGC